MWALPARLNGIKAANNLLCSGKQLLHKCEGNNLNEAECDSRATESTAILLRQSRVNCAGSVDIFIPPAELSIAIKRPSRLLVDALIAAGSYTSAGLATRIG